MIILYNPPESEEMYTGYSVEVNGKPIKTPAVRVSAMPYNTVWPGRQRPIEQTELAPMVSFESDEEVTLKIIYNTAPKEVTVRPLSKGVNADTDGNSATVVLSHPGSYTVEADGLHEALHVFFNPIKDFEIYTKTAKSILRYGPGVHNIGKVELFSDTTIIIDRDAYIYGSFISVNSENVVICGYGVIDGSLETRSDEDLLLPYDFSGEITKDREGLLAHLERTHVLDGIIRFYNCKNVHLEGVVLRDAATFAVIPANCASVMIDNVKTIGMWRYNADGIDLFNCRDVVIRNCFLRDFDDCIVLKGICGWDNYDMENILVEHCVVWCDWGRNLEIGAETNAPAYHNIMFRDCDCIHGVHVMCDIQHFDRAEIYDVTFENIRCEYSKHQLGEVYQHDMTAPYNPEGVEHPILLGIFIRGLNIFSQSGIHGMVHDIVFKDIQVLTDSDDIPMPSMQMVGLNEQSNVYRVRIENVTVDGTRVKSENAKMYINEFSSEVELI